MCRAAGTTDSQVSLYGTMGDYDVAAVPGVISRQGDAFALATCSKSAAKPPITGAGGWLPLQMCRRKSLRASSPQVIMHDRCPAQHLDASVKPCLRTAVHRS